MVAIDKTFIEVILKATKIIAIRYNAITLNKDFCRTIKIELNLNCLKIKTKNKTTK